MSTPFAGWAVIELMGHTRTAGFVSESIIAGEAVLKVDIPPTEDGGLDGFTRYWHPKALFSLSPVGEEVAKAFARRNRAEPVTIWELRERPTQALANRAEDDNFDDGFSDDFSGQERDNAAELVSDVGLPVEGFDDEAVLIGHEEEPDDDATIEQKKIYGVHLEHAVDPEGVS